MAQAIDDAYLAALRRRRDGHPAVRRGRPHGPRGGDTYKLQGLAAVVDIEDAATGTVRLKQHVDALDDLALEAGSVKTNRLHPSG